MRGFGPVNEGSTFAMFTVTATPGQSLDLTLKDAGTGTSAAYAGFGLQFSTDGSTWTSYDANHKPTAPSNGKVYVRVDIRTESDMVFEGAETFALLASFSSNPAKSAEADTAIVDDGTGAKYGPNLDPMNGPTTDVSNLDDDRSTTTPLTPPVLQPAAHALPKAELPPPVPTSPLVFASALQPLVLKTSVVVESPLSLVDVKTSASGYQIPVNETAPPGLTRYNGVTDQYVQSTTVSTKISLPFDAFIHSNKDAVIKLQAKQANDAPLPKWVQFDPVSGLFEVVPPKGFKGKLDLKVIARDDDGREAMATFQLFIGEQETPGKPQSRSSFSEKLRMASHRSMTLVRVSDVVPHKALATEPRALKVRAG